MRITYFTCPTFTIVHIKIKSYHGYANEQEIIIEGHVFRKKSPDDFLLNNRTIRHAINVIRLFTIKTIENAAVRLLLSGKQFSTKTLKDGYFRFSIPYSEPLDPGWHPFTLVVNHDNHQAQTEGEFVKPHPGEYGLISDIDDTFLVSHSGNPLKKIYVILTRNISKRNVFDDVVEHYRLLSRAGRKTKEGQNAFFYVSSSEWNLFNLIHEFTTLHKFPKAVIKLKKIKQGLGDFLFTGSGSHDHKFQKIKHLLEFYPELKFILLGDDSQKDPFIYRDIVKTFPENVVAIYIRQTNIDPKRKVETCLQDIQSMRIKCCYFDSSSRAIVHSMEIGLI